MTIKAFSREYLQQYIAQGIIFTTANASIQQLKDADPCMFLLCHKCDKKHKFYHPSQAPETDLICDCGYKVIEYDKD